MGVFIGARYPCTAPVLLAACDPDGEIAAVGLEVVLASVGALTG